MPIVRSAIAEQSPELGIILNCKGVVSGFWGARRRSEGGGWEYNWRWLASLHHRRIFCSKVAGVTIMLPHAAWAERTRNKNWCFSTYSDRAPNFSTSVNTQTGHRNLHLHETAHLQHNEKTRKMRKWEMINFSCPWGTILLWSLDENVLDFAPSCG